MANLPGLYFLKAYPREEIWRLFVDGRFWFKENGWQGYESREPGSLNAALESICSVALQIDEADEVFELSVDLIKEIHKRCGKKVVELEDKNPGEIRTDEPVSFGIPASRASIEGIEQFLNLFFLIEGEAKFGPGKAHILGSSFDKDYFENLNPEQIPDLAKKIYLEMSEYGHSKTNHFYLAVRKKVDVFLELITQSYNKEIKAANTMDEKLHIIAKYIRQYEVLHPFRDANGRTFVNNLLNILLMQQGLPPATFYEPNVFDLYSVDELVVVIKEAIFNTIEIIEKNKKGITLYGYNATLEDKSKFMEMLDSPSYTKIQDIDFSSLKSDKLLEKTRECFSSLSEKYPLHRGAIYLTDSTDIKLLITENESQINKRIKQGAPPLYVGKMPIHLAVMMRNIAMIDELIANKTDLSIQDYDGKTALHYAAEYGNMQIMGKILSVLLLRKDAISILNYKDNQGKTAFHYAAEFGNSELVNTLTTTDVIQINEPDSWGSSAITIAYKGHKLNIFEKLLNAGADISQELLDEILIRNDVESFFKIIAKNEHILSNKDAFGIAVRLGRVRLVRKFLQAGMDINVLLDQDNATPLMLAIRSGHIKLVDYLLRKGANPSLTDKSGASILQYVFYTRREYRETLIKRITDEDNSLINKANAHQIPPIYYPVVHHDFELVKLFLEMGATVDFEDKDGNNLLHSAMDGGSLPLIRAILSKDRTLLHTINSKGRNPFHQALHSTSIYQSPKEVDRKFIELMDYLVKEKVDLNTKDNNKMTILDIALSKSYYHLSVKLMGEGAHTNISSPSRYLRKCESESILKHPEDFKKSLINKLNGNPLIAMAQVDYLYIQIKNNNIKFPKNYAPAEGFIFFKGKSDDAKAHGKVLSILKSIYDSKLKELLGNYYRESAQEFKTKSLFLDENLKVLIENQEISRKIDKPSVQVIKGESYKIKW